jgi:selenocysteine lyase/cysteine desulfurase
VLGDGRQARARLLLFRGRAYFARGRAYFARGRASMARARDDRPGRGRRHTDGRDDVDWNGWRAEFPILGRSTYLNSCSLGALSRRAEARIATFHEQWHTYGAAAWYELWMGAIGELRGRVAGMLGAGEEEVAFTASTSVALATVASALDYRSRPRVVVAELDFPTLGYQWMVRDDVEVVRVPSDDGATIDPARFAEAVDERTAVLATSHVFFTTGAIQELRALADIAHRNGALFLVDAYQSVGQVPVDVRAVDADIFITGPLKWLMGGPGLAYLYVRSALIERLRPRIAGWFGARDQFAFDIGHFEFKDDARRFELGTPALPTVHAALGGQEIIDEIGVGAIRERDALLTERLIARARDAGFRVRCAPAASHRSAIVMIAHAEPGAAVGRLAERAIIVDSRPGYVRVSPHFYNTEEEIDSVVDVLAEGGAGDAR